MVLRHATKGNQSIHWVPNQWYATNGITFITPMAGRQWQAMAVGNGSRQWHAGNGSQHDANK